ncbi:MAG: PfkB family carbohydrate kinase [Terriglobales bacterium]
MDFNVIGVGEVLWDLLPGGPQLGGAPANFAYHAHALGARVRVITRIGNDDYGREIVRRFREIGLPDSTVQVDETTPTGTATVTLEDDRLAHFSIQEDVAWDHIAATAEAITLAHAADAICFGTLAQRTASARDAIQQIVAATPRDALRVFDINLRQQFYSREVIESSLVLANILKLNDDELPTLAAMFKLAGATRDQMEQLARMFRLQLVALTRGSNGSLLYQHSNEIGHLYDGGASGGRYPRETRDRSSWSDCESRPLKVVDTVGAGDSFTAALVLGLLQQMDLNEVNILANDVARYVCSQPGATPILPVEFARRLVTKSQ